MTLTGPMTHSDRVATLEQAKAQLRKSVGCLEGVGEAGRGPVTTIIPAAHAVWSVVQSEDGKAWDAKLNWDDGRQDRILRFETKEKAEAWIRGGVTLGF
jgi:hypothetical protein